jgi:hypothetical protein
MLKAAIRPVFNRVIARERFNDFGVHNQDFR